ncbi:MAG: hypothetical protein JNJ70_13475 [Verrucomicrobiales bacterium]|nr:hypothetical protein [Verrucomicrobiales bacterium]
MKNHLLTALVVSTTASFSGTAADYVSEILPIMKEHCWDCHSNETEVKGNVALDPDVLADQIGAYNVIRPGNPAESGFVERLKLDETHNDFMPRKGKPLPKREIEKIEAWIQAGAIIDAKKPTEDETKRMAEMKPAAPSAGAAGAEAGFQSWTNREGKVIEARLLGLEGDAAKLLLKNGKSYVVPLSSLSEESAKMARESAAP